ncbi:MAG: DNA primase [Dehalococcoidia bacterium]
MSTVDEIKHRLDMVDVAGAYLELKQAGRNLKALCPFHQEKTPSFFVFPDKQSWRCFGCGAGGDIISFVMKKESVDFSEALKMLAEKAGISLIRKKEPAEDKATDRLYRMNEAAAQCYHDLLLKEPIAETARQYVVKRGLTQETVADFQLGFSSREGLKKRLIEQGYGESELITAGLLREKEGRTYDLFHHRLIFPIRDIKGKVVGFGARALNDSLPKYLNSPQTAIFDKGGALYGIDRARSAIRERKLAVIVEGYMDVITAHQHGMANVVASMGTALTEKQIRILRGLTKSLVFALDPDVAGDAATLRGIEVARSSLDREDLVMPNLLGTTSRLKADMKIISLPQGKDPDTLIREDFHEWQQLVDRALPLVDHLIAVASSRLDLTKPEGRSQASEQLLPMIAELDDDMEREFYLGKLATLLGVSERTLIGMAARMHRPRRAKAGGAVPKSIATAYSGDRLEEGCLSLLLQHSELRDQAGGLLAEHFERSENREIFVAWRNASNPDELSWSVSVDLQEHLETLVVRILPPAGEKESETELAACVCRLEERRLRLQDEIVTSEGVLEFSNGIELDSERLAALQQKPLEVNARLVEKMQERTEHSFPDRGSR